MIRYLAVIPLVLIPGLLLGGFAQANDQLGIYWDAEFTQDSISTDTFPSIHTGYLVLMDPTSVLGVSKWECCVGIEGPAIFISWVLAGQALNLETPPCFWVSISSDPLPAGGPVLLATFMTMVTEELPVSLSVVPLANPTLPDRMSFTSADDPANPLPMFSVTGNPEVAWVNKHVPLLEIDREHVIFHDTIVGYPKTEIITVTNLGFVDVDLTAAFSDTSGVYALSSPGNPATIPARSVVDLEITFAPSGSGYFSSYLDLGGLLPEVLLAGNGLGGNLSWEMDPVLDFGGVEIDRFKWGYLTIINTGEVPFPVDPSLPGGISCSAFEFTFGPAPTTLGPADTLTFQLTFSPPADRPYSCALALGEVLPDVTLQGVGFVDVLDWIAPTTMTLGPVGIGSSVEQTIQIQNTGTIPFSVDPTFPVPCAEFFIEQGAGEIDLAPGANLNVRVKFEPASIGSSICTLDLGEVVPPVTLTGLGRDPVLI